MGTPPVVQNPGSLPAQKSLAPVAPATPRSHAGLALPPLMAGPRPPLKADDDDAGDDDVDDDNAIDCIMVLVAKWNTGKNVLAMMVLLDIVGR